MLISAAILIIYLIVASIIAVMSGMNPQVVIKVGIPTSLPKIVYFYFFPPTAEDFKMTLTAKVAVLGLASLIVNLVLYAIPPFLILSLLRLPRKKIKALSDYPPLPTEFNLEDIAD